MARSNSTIHASAVLIGARAVLIRGASGVGKSQLAWTLISAAPMQIPFARLVADDSAFVEAHHDRLIARPAPELAGLLEIRGLGIRRLSYEALAVVGLVVDLAVPDADRLPARKALETQVLGITLPRLPIAASQPALPDVLAMLRTAASGD
jgi:serine kinase of HPr protein (carbohydrate metabolism regulator)